MTPSQLESHERYKDKIISLAIEVLEQIDRAGMKNFEKLRTRARHGFSEYYVYGYEGFLVFLLSKSENAENLRQILIKLKKNEYENVTKLSDRNFYAIYFALILLALERLGLINLEKIDQMQTGEFVKHIFNQLLDKDKKRKIRLYIDDILAIYKQTFNVIRSPRNQQTES
jgi:hypothetical protein